MDFRSFWMCGIQNWPILVCRNWKRSTCFDVVTSPASWVIRWSEHLSGNVEVSKVLGVHGPSPISAVEQPGWLGSQKYPLHVSEHTVGDQKHSWNQLDVQNRANQKSKFTFLWWCHWIKTQKGGPCPGATPRDLEITEMRILRAIGCNYATSQVEIYIPFKTRMLSCLVCGFFCLLFDFDDFFLRKDFNQQLEFTIKNWYNHHIFPLAITIWFLVASWYH